MIFDDRGDVDFEECGQGPTILFVPGSCSTSAAWRGVVETLRTRFRCITTSLAGYGGTTERRAPQDPSIAHVAEGVEVAMRAAGAPVHLVGHSFGGLVALAVALRQIMPLASLTMLEPPAVNVLALDPIDAAHALAFRRMSDEYRDAHGAGDCEAIVKMIDFYGGNGTFLSWPPKVRAYALETTPVNLTDWRSAYEFKLDAALFAKVAAPTLVVRGSESHEAMQRLTQRLSEFIRCARLGTIKAAAHFMISSHPREVAAMIERHVDGAGGNDRCTSNPASLDPLIRDIVA